MGRQPDDFAWVSSQIESLSARQRDVLRLVARGLANKEIGSSLGISGETVRTHVTAVLERLGVQNRTEAARSFLLFEARPSQVAIILKRPAIAVLPFLVPAGSRRVASIAAGLERDLCDLFARWCSFPVIAGVSTIDARSLGSTSQEIGERLGARFLVDGMLRQARRGLRISIRIIDAPSGRVIWSDAHEFALAGLFEVQDSVCQAVVAAAYPRLNEMAFGHPPCARAPGLLEPWEQAHEAMALQSQRSRESNALAQSGFRIALEREPGLVLAHFGLGLASYDEVLNQWGPSGAALDRLAACAERCRDLAPEMAEGYYLSGRHHQSRGAHHEAVVPLCEAIGRNPSFAAAHALLGQVYLLSGGADEGLTHIKHAVRLSPRSFVAGLAVAHFVRGEHHDALAAAERAVSTNPRYPFAHALAAACAFWLGQRPTAERHLATLLALQPSFAPRDFLKTFGANVEAVSRLVQALEALRSGASVRGSS